MMMMMMTMTTTTTTTIAVVELVIGVKDYDSDNSIGVFQLCVDRDNVVGIATRYGLNGPRRSAADRLLGLRVRIPPGHGSLSCV
jgi:hypothetical protein